MSWQQSAKKLITEFGKDAYDRLVGILPNESSVAEAQTALGNLISGDTPSARPKSTTPKSKGKAAAPKSKDTAAAPLAAKRGILSTPDLRAMTAPSAVAAARTQPHLMQDAAGQYVGAPRGVTTPEQIAAMREAFDADVAAGAGGADWYTRARASNMDWAGPDPARQRLLAQEQALWSAQANPDTNMNFGFQGHNAYEMGMPLETARTPQQAKTYNTARDLGVEIPLGPKTGVYGQHLDPTAPHATTGTNDIWHARGFGYTDSDGGTFSRALSDQEHRFLDYETMLAVDRANAAGLQGRTDWQAHEIQAAPWVAGKGRGLAMQSAKSRLEKERGIGDNGGPPMAIEPTPEELAAGIARASMTYPDYRGKYTAQATSERVPYVGAEHLSGIVSGSPDLRAAYSSDPRASWTTGEGRDILYDALGAYQTPTMPATGVYKPPVGALETNPATVAKPLVGLSGGDVDPASRRMLDIAEGLRAYTDAQGAGAWHHTMTNVPAGQQGSIFIPGTGAMGADRLLQLKALGAQHGLPDIVDTGEGVTLTNFYPGPPSGTETGKALKAGLSSQLAALSGGQPARTKVVGSYLDTFEDAGGPGSGVATDRLLGRLAEYPPSVIDRLDADKAVRARYASGADLDAEMMAKGYGNARPDIQTARRILSEGGLRGLMEARQAGVALPSIAALLATYGLTDRTSLDGGTDE